MKKKYIIMFLILQFLLIITNLFNIERELFDIDLSLILKIIVEIFSFLLILFASKLPKRTKIFLISLLIFISSTIVFENNSYDKLINNFYYVSTYSFLLFYYSEMKYEKYKFINIMKYLLIATNIFMLLSDSRSFTLELIVCILLPISLMYYDVDKKYALIAIITSFLVGINNYMNLVLLSLIIIELYLAIRSLIKRENRLFSIAVLFITTILSVYEYSYVLKKNILLSGFNIFDIHFEIYSIVTITPLIIILL